MCREEEGRSGSSMAMECRWDFGMEIGGRKMRVVYKTSKLGGEGRVVVRCNSACYCKPTHLFGARFLLYFRALT